MYGSIRNYRKIPGDANELVPRAREIEKAIRSAPGFIAYYMLKTKDGLASVTVCDTQVGTEESNRLAAKWIKENMPSWSMTPPEITGGEVIMQFGEVTARTKSS